MKTGDVVEAKKKYVFYQQICNGVWSKKWAEEETSKGTGELVGLFVYSPMSEKSHNYRKKIMKWNKITI